MRYLRFFLLLLTSIVIVACGGGGGGEPTPSVSQVLDDGLIYDVHNTIVINDAAQSEFLAADANNYYSFNVTKGQKYTITLNSLTGGDSDLAVFNNNELSASSLIGLSILTTSPDVVTFTATETKTYYLEVYNSLAGDYTLLISASSRTLANGVMYPTSGYGVKDLHVGDMNGDGLDDIAYMTSTIPPVEVGVYYQKNDGSFSKGFSLNYPDSEGYDVYAIAIGDVNNDSGNDLVVAAYNFNNTPQGFLRVHRQNTVTKIIDSNYSSYPSDLAIELAVVDINNDNRNDILSLNSNLTYYLQDIAGNFNSNVVDSFGIVYGTSQIKLLDVSNDNDLDILYDSVGRNSVILVNNPVGAFEDATTLTGLTDYSTVINIQDVGDINGDMLTDVVMLDSIGSSALLNIFAQISAGSFNRSTSLSPFRNFNVCEMVIVDITGDSLLDLVGYDGGTGKVLVAKQLNNFQFEDAIPYTAFPTNPKGGCGGAAKRLATGDFNNDGYTDVVVGYIGDWSGIYILLSEPG